MSVIATDMLAGTAADRLDAGLHPRLSTDFLNRYSEALMLIEMAVMDESVLADLAAMAGGATAVVDRVTRLYETQSAEKLRDLHEAARSGDLDRLGAAAHALKSMSFNVGARRVAERAAGLERAARIEVRPVAEGEIETLGADLSAALAAIASRPSAA